MKQPRGRRPTTGRSVVLTCIALAASAAGASRAETEPAWEAVKLRVSQRHMESGFLPFHGSLAYWSRGYLRTRKWTAELPGDLTEPLRVDGRAAVLVHGDVRADVTLGRESLLHIEGDLSAVVTVAGHTEVIVGGSLLPQGRIVADGIVSVYVEGDVDGDVVSAHSLQLFVGGNLMGEVVTGDPSTHVLVEGDGSGKLRPDGKGALLTISVHGFMPTKALPEVARRYTSLEAFVARSDRPAGFYELGGPGSLVVAAGVEGARVGAEAAAP